MRVVILSGYVCFADGGQRAMCEVILLIKESGICVSAAMSVSLVIFRCVR